MKRILVTFLVALITLAGSCLSAYASGNDPRIKSGHPSNVTGLHLVSIDRKLNQLVLAWNPNKLKEGVDRYAIYAEGESQPPVVKAIKIISGTSANLTLSDFSGNVGGVADRRFWVIAHNKFGWGVNDFNAADPDQNFKQFDNEIITRTASTLLVDNPLSFLELHYILVQFKN